MKNKWSKIWREFNGWCDNYCWALWAGQRRKLTQLIRAEFPNVNTRKLWAYFNNECDKRDNKAYTLSWKKQQIVIRNAVAAQG